MDGLLDAFDRALRNLAAWGGGVLLFAMVALTFAHVVLRYAFSDPIKGFVDLGQVLLVFLVAFTVAYSGRTGGQIAVELIDGLVGGTVLRRVEVAVRLAGAAMILILAARLVGDGPKAQENGEATTTLGISFEPFFYALGLGVALYGAVLLLEAAALIAGRDVGREQARLFREEDGGAL